MKHLPKTRVENWIEGFLSTMLSEQTRRQYRPQLYKFSDWLTKRGFITGNQFLTPETQDIHKYLGKLLKNKVPLSMRREALIAIRSWFNYLAREGHVKDNPASRIENITLPKHLYRPLTEKQVQSAFASIDEGNSSWPARERAIFETIYEDALSAEEICALNVADVVLRNRTISIKGTKLPFEETLANAFRAYLAERKANLANRGIDLKSIPTLFISTQDRSLERRLDPHQLGNVLRRIDPQICPRKLRDACGIHMLNHGADPRIIAALYRAGIHAIDRLQAMASTKRRERLRNCHPRAKLQ